MPAPIGNVSTLTGIYALSVKRMIQKIDGEYATRFPFESDALGKLRDIIGTMCIAHEDHFESQSMRFIHFVSVTVGACSLTDCPEKGLHELMLTCAEDFANMPLKVYDEAMQVGKLPGVSMN